MHDLTVQYGKSEALHLLALKELSDKYEPKNHAEVVAMDDKDDAYAAIEALLAELRELRAICGMDVSDAPLRQDGALRRRRAHE